MWPGQLPANLLQQVLAADPPLHTRGKSRFVAGATHHDVAAVWSRSVLPPLHCPTGGTALHSTVFAHDLEGYEALLRAGEDPSLADDTDNLPTYYACDPSKDEPTCEFRQQLEAIERRFGWRETWHDGIASKAQNAAGGQADGEEKAGGGRRKGRRKRRPDNRGE